MKDGPDRGLLESLGEEYRQILESSYTEDPKKIKLVRHLVISLKGMEAT